MGRRENKIGNEGKAGGKSCRKQGGKNGTAGGLEKRKLRRRDPRLERNEKIQS